MDAEAEHVVSDVDKRLPKTTAHHHQSYVEEYHSFIQHDPKVLSGKHLPLLKACKVAHMT